MPVPAIPPSYVDQARLKANQRILRAFTQGYDTFRSPPLNPAPAYAASTAYSAGDVVSSNGLLFMQIGGGTSGAGGGLDVTSYSGGTINDNGLLWTSLGGVEITAPDIAAPQMFLSNGTQPLNYSNNAVVGVGTVLYTAGGAKQVLYLVTGTGTTAASGTPQHTSGSATDGTATLQFIAQPRSGGLGNPHYLANSSGTGILPNAFRCLGGAPAFNSSYTELRTLRKKASDTTAQNAKSQIEFETDDEVLSVQCFSCQRMQVEIDGRRISYTGIRFPSGYGTAYLVFGARKMRKFKITYYGLGVRDFRVGSRSQIKPPRRKPLRLALCSDSIWDGSAFSPFLGGGSFSQRVGPAIGFDDAWDFSIGGTGVLNPSASNFYTFFERVPQLLACNPDMILLGVSGNDNPVGGYTLPQLKAAVKAGLIAIRAGTSAPIVILGCWQKDANAALMDTQWRDAMNEIGDPYTKMIETGTLAAEGLPWLTVNGVNNVANTASQTSTLMVGGDGTHPIDLALGIWADHTIEAIHTQGALWLEAM